MSDQILSQISPGPWRVEEHEYFCTILDRDNNKLAEVFHPRSTRKGPITEDQRQIRRANAQAMAAAWTLLQPPLIEAEAELRKRNLMRDKLLRGAT